ncbi:unnamed protein product [Tuwongella immobilis]|uniref:Uncharacterized protein n=1 Tax=Tuwongella immobilis TaxID=692036 RepID=A0A6C2YHN3_9BACT|nr:unnamed protein product [Tuwongella immobilis]VTR97272.1 unnamed protein product [Tuwongella immobilis]
MRRFLLGFLVSSVFSIYLLLTAKGTCNELVEKIRLGKNPLIIKSIQINDQQPEKNLEVTNWFESFMIDSKSGHSGYNETVGGRTDFITIHTSSWPPFQIRLRFKRCGHILYLWWSTHDVWQNEPDYYYLDVDEDKLPPKVKLIFDIPQLKRK